MIKKRIIAISLCSLLVICFSVFTISNNKVYALSQPTTSDSLTNAYTGALHNFNIDIVGANNTKNLNPTELQVYDNGDLTFNGYGSYGGYYTTHILTTLDMTRTNGYNITNDYYDGGAQSNLYIRQSVTSDNNYLYCMTYRAHKLSLYITQPQIIYNINDALNNFRIWYYNPVGYNDTEPVDSNAPNPFNMRTSNQVTLMRFILNFEYTDINNTIQQVEYIDYTNLFDLSNNNSIVIPDTIINQLSNAPTYNNCKLINSMSLTVDFWQRSYTSAQLSYSNNARTFEYLKEQNKLMEEYVIPLYASNIYFLVPFYNQSIYQTQTISKYAQELYLNKYFEDYVTINDFWLGLIDFEIFPNFKLSYFLYFALGLILMLVFVRMFR